MLQTSPYGRQILANLGKSWHLLYYTSRLSIEPIHSGKIRGNVRFAAFWCVFLTKMKVDPESWCNKLSIKQLRMKIILKNNFT